jgi:general secretion pathway protein J
MKAVAPRARRRRAEGGLTLLEVLVSIAILAMIATLIYGAFDSLSRGKRAEAKRGDRARQARNAIDRMVRELAGAYVSMHQPHNVALQTRATGIVGRNGNPFDRIDFSAFAHRRLERESKESDQAEIGYFVAADPEVDGKMDLVRREQVPMDMDLLRGGVVNVLCENVESFDLRYLDPATGMWVEAWDTTSVTAQLNRIPLAIRVTLVLKDVPSGVPSTYTTKIMLPIRNPLTFGIPQ